MAATRQPHGQTPGTHAGDPGDVPAERPTSLDRLDVPIGQWEMEATFEAGYFGPGSPAITGRCPARRLVPSVGDAGMADVTDGGNTR